MVSSHYTTTLRSRLTTWLCIMALLFSLGVYADVPTAGLAVWESEASLSDPHNELFDKIGGKPNLTFLEAASKVPYRPVHVRAQGIGWTMNGHRQYVAYFYRNNRWVLSVVQVLRFQNAISQALHNTADFAAAMTNNARSYLGYQTGRWATHAWSFYTGLNGDGFTVVSKLMLPRGITEASEAIKLVKMLANLYGFTSDIPSFNPTNNNYKHERRAPFDPSADHIGDNNTIAPAVADEHSDRLQDYGIFASHPINDDFAKYFMVYFTPEYFGAGHLLTGSSVNGTTDASAVEKRSETSTCQNNPLLSSRYIYWLPWPTEKDTGCVGDVRCFRDDLVLEC
ncbi:hypothetical protein IAR55_003540 [Kwoniella newhampshirensis]|uniref:Alginate lyase domain-containing protein n=1 Tax=Kwoniella newhampshirensis TaxID=1651941 RepID=A0AAW0YR58_9TREE